MCGQKAPSTRKVRIEGTVMSVCARCSKFGDEVKKKTEEKKTPPIVANRIQMRERKKTYRDVFESQGMSEVLVEDFSIRITRARNSKNMTQKELAARINEKLSVINSLEKGVLRPDDKLIKKLEKELGISLKEQIGEVKSPEKRAYSQGVTLGDLIQLK